jgi:hypothetical protein
MNRIAAARFSTDPTRATPWQLYLRLGSCSEHGHAVMYEDETITERCDDHRSAPPDCCNARVDLKAKARSERP